MNIFDLLSEAKIKDWLRKKKSKDYVPPLPVEKTAPGKAFEGHLLDDIKIITDISKVVFQKDLGHNTLIVFIFVSKYVRVLFQIISAWSFVSLFQLFEFITYLKLTKKILHEIMWLHFSSKTY